MHKGSLFPHLDLSYNLQTCTECGNKIINIKLLKLKGKMSSTILVQSLCLWLGNLNNILLFQFLVIIKGSKSTWKTSGKKSMSHRKLLQHSILHLSFLKYFVNSYVQYDFMKYFNMPGSSHCICIFLLKYCDDI